MFQLSPTKITLWASGSTCAPLKERWAGCRQQWSQTHTRVLEHCCSSLSTRAQSFLLLNSPIALWQTEDAGNASLPSGGESLLPTELEGGPTDAFNNLLPFQTRNFHSETRFSCLMNAEADLFLLCLEGLICYWDLFLLLLGTYFLPQHSRKSWETLWREQQTQWLPLK